MSEMTDGDTKTDPAPQTDPEPSSPTAEPPPAVPGSAVMLLGSGELSRELSLASGAITTAHADFWNVWDQDKLEGEVADCLNRDLVCGVSG